MAKIKSVAQAIGIIGKEVEKMGAEEKPKPRKYCIECNAAVMHYGANFCQTCAMSFYNDSSTDNDKEGTE